MSTVEELQEEYDSLDTKLCAVDTQIDSLGDERNTLNDKMGDIMADIDFYERLENE